MGEIKNRDVEEFSKKQGESKFLTDRRLDAFTKLQQMPSAIYKYGLGIVTNFEIDINELKLFNPSTFEIKNNSKAVVVNFTEAGAEIDENFMTTFEVDSRLLAMNTAFLNSGVLIKLPKDTDCGTIHLKLNGTDADFSHILIVAEEGSKATIINEMSSDSTSYRSEVVEIIAKPNSEIMFGSVQKLPDCKNFSYRKAVIERNANVEWLDITTGGSLTKSEIYSDLNGEKSKTSVFNIFFGNSAQQYDFYTKCNHIGRNTESQMYTSGALTDNAKAVQQGFAKISEKAYNTVTHQKSKILLLSENAKAVPTPKLEIDNNDVVATHQASVGQIDSEKVFYLMSRGIDEKEAKKLFVEGFFEQYLSKVPVAELREDVQSLVAERMDNG